MTALGFFPFTVSERALKISQQPEATEPVRDGLQHNRRLRVDGTAQCDPLAGAEKGRPLAPPITNIPARSKRTDITHSRSTLSITHPVNVLWYSSRSVLYTAHSCITRMKSLPYHLPNRKREYCYARLSDTS